MRQHRYEYILDILDEKNISVNQKTIIDCACGDGVGSKHLKKAGALVTAIDVDEKEAKTCLGKGLDARQGDIRNLELPSNYYDLFFCCETLEHLIESDCPKAASEIQRVTKPDGIICITVPKYKDSCFHRRHKGRHKTWVQRQDIEKWFDRYYVVFEGEFMKNPKNKEDVGLSLVLGSL